MPTDPLTPTLTVTACYRTQQTEVIYRRGEQVIFQRIFHAFECELDSYIYSHQGHLHALTKISEALKLKGEICEYQKDYYRAFRSYTLAIKLNPHLDIQKNLDRVASHLHPDLIDSVNMALGLYANAMIRMNKDVKNTAYKKYSVK